MSVMDETLKILTSLQTSPLFHLSLSSKELFHSNYLAWCCQSFRRDMENIFSDLIGMKIAFSDSENFVRREKGNHDLEIDLQGDNKNKLVFEVKVKSVPDKNQLQKYSESLAVGDIMVLLTLTGHNDNAISITVNNYNIKCFSMKLKDVAQRIHAIKSNDPYRKSLCEDYFKFVDDLSTLADNFKLSFKDTDSGFFLLKEPRMYSVLAKYRLHDLIYKMRYDQLSIKITNELNASKTSWINGKRDEFVTESAMTNGTGITSVGYMISGNDGPYQAPIIAGIQLQEKDYRYFFHICDINATNYSNMTEAISRELCNSGIWFKLDEVNDYGLKIAKRNKGNFCKYSNNFYYKYLQFTKDVQPENLVKFMVKDARSIQVNATKFRKVISNYLYEDLEA